MAKPVDRKNPYAAFNFLVRLDKNDGKDPVAGFMEASGLDGENAVIEYRNGNDQKDAKGGAFVRKQPGIERYPNVVLKRGITGSTALWTMRKKIRDAEKGPELKDATPDDFFIDLQNEQHETVLSWRLQNAWISKLSGPSLNAKSNEIAVESVEITCERIEIVES